MLRIAVVLIVFEYFVASEMVLFEKELYIKEREKIKVITLFCEDKYGNFCSPENLSYMYKVLKLEREQQLEAKQKQLNLKNFESQQEFRKSMLKRFLEAYPSFRIIMDFLTNRPF